MYLMLYLKYMEPEAGLIPSGGVTTPRGFLAGATSAGIKYARGNRLDLAILSATAPCCAAGVFTSNRVKAAPVLFSQQRLREGEPSALVVNSGCANACTGERGLADAAAMAALAAAQVGKRPAEVLVASTGVIGVPLPMDRIRAGIPEIELSPDGGGDLARAIMTTDTVPKEVAVRAGGFTIGGAAKGSGMIHPDMATLLGFLTTDAPVEKRFLREALREAVDVSFNMVSIDGDTSTNDTVLVLANGLAGGVTINKDSPRAAAFRQALSLACRQLALAIARDGEGATRLIEVKVTGAASLAEARLAARTIVNSPLVKSAVHGGDPNWGRVLAAAGRSGVALAADKLELGIGGICLVREGCPVPFPREEVVKHLGGPDVHIELDLNIGPAEAEAWGCDLSEEYVTINSEYTT
jgi:glutamate N-acetyltransferase / amino-acid N-acetyltransferase